MNNTGGNSVAAHIFVVNGNYTAINGANTGFATGTPSVPDGGITAAMLGVALLGLGALRRKIGKN
jgi:hypothetical protein